MNAANRHRIQRQVLELDIASAAEAREVQEQAARPFRQGAPEIEALFDRVAGPGELLRLERVEVDLGELRGPDWQEQLVARLLDRLSGSLERPTAKAADPRSEAESGTGASPEEAVFAQFLFFLSQGRLPWWGRKPDRPWTEAPPAPLHRAQWRSLCDLLRREARARARFAVTVGDELLDATIVELAGLEGATAVMRSLAPSPGPDRDGVRRRWRQRFWLEVIELAVAQRSLAVGGPEALKRLLAESARPVPPRDAPPTGRKPSREGAPRLPHDLPRPWREWAETALRDLDEATAPAAAAPPADRPAGRPDTDRPASEGLREQAPAVAPEALASAGAEGRPAPSGAPLPGEPRSGPGSTAGQRPGEIEAPSPHAVPQPGDEILESSPTPARPASVTDAVYVEGAGVVILHPFLEELFASRGLLDERLFRDEAARQRAVHLLARLSFGESGTAEYDLLVPKLLCAMPWEEPLTPGELSDEEVSACDELLAAVLGHWSALQSSSPAWLREQFFLRDGKLEPVDGGWKLTVERRAQDVLLTRLPWGLGAIRHPWMTEMLHVCWAE